MSDAAPTVEVPTNLVDLLDQLVLPPDPEPVSMIPQTGGWIVLLLLVLIGVVLGLKRLHDHRVRNAYRVEALASLNDAEDSAAIATVLRRCALVAYPRVEVASLTGAEWLAFLDRSEGGTTFTEGPGQALATAPYRTHEAADAGLLEAARHWVRVHKAQTV